MRLVRSQSGFQAFRAEAVRLLFLPAGRQRRQLHAPARAGSHAALECRAAKRAGFLYRISAFYKYPYGYLPLAPLLLSAHRKYGKQCGNHQYGTSIILFCHIYILPQSVEGLQMWQCDL